MPYPNKSAVDTLKEALADLGFDYVDLYLVHFPIALVSAADYSTIPVKSKPIHKMWAEMEECVKLGLTKSIGVSNFNC
jgi:diketogulonate reductase-like aldo/keto reductase